MTTGPGHGTPMTMDAIELRTATLDEAPALHALIEANRETGHLLPRPLDELGCHAPRFVVAVEGPRVLACAELAPLSAAVAEVRSLVVDERHRGVGLGTRLVEALTRRARRDGFDTLCAFTHDPKPFVRLGFSIVPHVWVPEKIATDCHRCPLFRRCGQYAVVYPLASRVRDGRRNRTVASTVASSGLSLLPVLS